MLDEVPYQSREGKSRLTRKKLPIEKSEKFEASLPNFNPVLHEEQIQWQRIPLVLRPEAEIQPFFDEKQETDFEFLETEPETWWAA